MRIKSEWKLNKIFVNGTDCTQNYNDSLINDDFTSMKMNIIKDGVTSEFVGVINSESKSNYTNGINLDKSKNLFFTKWRFNSGGNNTYDTLNLKCINRIIGFGQYKILKLYNKNFIIKVNQNNKTYEFQFKK